METHEKSTGKSKAELLTLIDDLQSKLKEKDTLVQKKDILIQEKDILIKDIRFRLNVALQSRFGRKSEKQEADSLQIALFDEAIPPDNEEAIADAEREIQVPAHSRKQRKRKAISADFPRVRKEFDIAEDEKTCVCGTELTKIGEDITERLETIPAQHYVIQEAKLKYACKSCEETVRAAKAPKMPIQKSIAGPGLLAHVLVSKFCDHLPFYRQESIFRRAGIDIELNTLCFGP